MPTFPKGYHAFELRVANAKRLAKLTPDERRAITSTFEFPDPVDIRGIPAVGRSISGHIRGTQPESAATR